MKKNKKDLYEVKLFISFILIVTFCISAFFMGEAQAHHPADTKVYAITLETERNHKVLKVKYVFLDIKDIHHLMWTLKNDQTGGVITDQLFKRYLEDSKACEIEFKFYNVSLVASGDFYHIYEIHNTIGIK